MCRILKVSQAVCSKEQVWPTSTMDAISQMAIKCVSCFCAARTVCYVHFLCLMSLYKVLSAHFVADIVVNAVLKFFFIEYSETDFIGT